MNEARTPRDVFDFLVGRAFVIDRNPRYRKPGSLLETLSEEQRKLLQDLRAEHINDRIDTFL